ncbi:chitin binding peritrophin-A-like protein [Nocardia tenerifensis]|uniref:Chitin binding peritrophin-A-like protein n=1 Tax=Nocardia tenerifensis TaxID=228006 RepID=A0A318JV69_9NOCA|nr:chitin binding peritrophin-A domain-containing protein [Nocardia tenerifensis]PXX59635.1 chitin binding peritrophin-A-like protein [Nocardia tenerifensis]
MKSNSLVHRTGVLATGAVIAMLPSLGVAALTLCTLAAVDVPERAGRDVAARQYAVIPIESRSDFCRTKSEGHYADPHDHAVFYRCMNSRRRMATYEFRCADGAWYDDERLACVARR